MKKLKIYCGETIEDLCDKQLHPLTEVKNAEHIVRTLKDDIEVIIYSNSPEFISTVKYLSPKYNVESEFFLNEVSTGDDIELIFGDFNKSYILMYELTENK